MYDEKAIEFFQRMNNAHKQLMRDNVTNTREKLVFV
jgi:hypothetical protein